MSDRTQTMLTNQESLFHSYDKIDNTSTITTTSFWTAAFLLTCTKRRRSLGRVWKAPFWKLTPALTSSTLVLQQHTGNFASFVEQLCFRVAYIITERLKWRRSTIVTMSTEQPPDGLSCKLPSNVLLWNFNLCMLFMNSCLLVSASSVTCFYTRLFSVQIQTSQSLGPNGKIDIEWHGVQCCPQVASLVKSHQVNQSFSHSQM